MASVPFFQVKEAVIEAVGGWGGLVQDLWEKATSQVAAQCTTILQVCACVGPFVGITYERRTDVRREEGCSSRLTACCVGCWVRFFLLPLCYLCVMLLGKACALGSPAEASVRWLRQHTVIWSLFESADRKSKFELHIQF